MKRALACLLLLLLLPLPALAEESAAFSVPSLWGNRSASLPWEENWFAQSAYTYHHGLARVSLGLAVSAFRGQDQAKDGPIRSFLSQLRFDAIQTWDFASPGENTVGTAVAWRMAGGAPLVALAFSGGNVGDEWAGSLQIGLTGDHAGFSLAAQIGLDRVRQYIRQQGLSNAQLWITGFGRGAAVANIVAAAMEEFLPPERIFAYTFACPYTVTAVNGAVHNHIFNVVAASDPMTMLPPRAWGFTRYGQTLYLPSALDGNHDYSALLPAYAAVARQFTGRADTVGDADLAPMAQAAVNRLAGILKDRSGYHQTYQALLTKVFTDQSLKAGEMLRAGALMTDLSLAARKAQRGKLPALPAATLGVFTSKELSALYAQHDPAVYVGWMLALTEGNVLFTSSLTLTDVP